MATKTTGAEFKRYYNDPTFWPEGAWHEDVTFLIDGEAPSNDFDMSTVADGAAVSIVGGVVLGASHDGREPSVETHFNRWRKLQTLKTLVVEVEEARLEAVSEAIKAAGGKVVQ